MTLTLLEGGHLRISTAEVQRRLPRQEKLATLASLVISDDDVGMDAETRSKIFEPFFTTKGKGRGTGLGMAVVSAAVERHAGFLELESEPGKGTTFSLFFPLAEEPPDDTAMPTPSSLPMSPGRETVLVVDDDEGSRKMLTRYLQKHGYTLLTASDGQQALEILARTDKVDLIVSDSVMPRLSGRELLDAVSKQRPDMPFLFCSGFPAGAISADVLESPHRALLVKPFSEEALLDKVRQLLEAARPSESS
jgi:CheY-like chemotaxis protein